MCIGAREKLFDNFPKDEEFGAPSTWRDSRTGGNRRRSFNPPAAPKPTIDCGEEPPRPGRPAETVDGSAAFLWSAANERFVCDQHPQETKGSRCVRTALPGCSHPSSMHPRDAGRAAVLCGFAGIAHGMPTRDPGGPVKSVWPRGLADGLAAERDDIAYLHISSGVLCLTVVRARIGACHELEQRCVSASSCHERGCRPGAYRAQARRASKPKNLLPRRAA